MRADRLVGIADRDRELEGRLEAAPHIEPLSVGARHRREHMRADRLVGIADRDRELEGRLEAAFDDLKRRHEISQS